MPENEHSVVTPQFQTTAGDNNFEDINKYPLFPPLQPFKWKHMGGYLNELARN